MPAFRECATFGRNGPDGYQVNFSLSDPYDDEHVKSYDNMLHQTLSKIFREHCHTSGQIKELLRASEHVDRNSCIIKLILKLEPALSEIFPDGNKLSLLWITVLECYQRSANLLVRSGADVNERFGTSLHEAFLDEESTILHCLIKMYPSSWNERFIGLVTKYGADLKARDLTYDCTLLHNTAGFNRFGVAKMLLKKGADVNAVDNLGRTPLLIASCCSVADKLTLLFLDHGADITTRDAAGMNALHHFAFATLERPNQVRALIKKGASLEDRCNLEGQYQPLYQAARQGKVELVKLFLDCSGVDVNARRAEDGVFLLYVAAEEYVEIVENNMNSCMLLHLLQCGANIDLKTNDGRTALHSACCKLELNNINILLFYGADMCVEDHEGNTPYSLLDTMLLDIDRLHECIELMIRMLALKKTCQPSIALKDEIRIRQHDMRWLYYQGCIEQISKMKSTRLIGTFTFFDLCTKCLCQIAKLMRNPELDSKFKQSDLTIFSEYSEKMIAAIDLAKQYYCAMLKQEDVIDEALYNSLPHMIVRKVARYALGCTECTTKRVVHASRDQQYNNSEDNSNAPREQ